MITKLQIRAARALLGWGAEELARHSDLTRETVSNIENGLVRGREGSLERIEHAFLANKIEFIEDRGVALKNDLIVTLSGENIFFRLLDDVIATLRNEENAEALFACVNDRLSPPTVVENYRRLRNENIKMRSLVKEGDTYLMGNLDEYRYLPEEFYHNNATVLYGNKFATMILDSKTGEDAGAVILHNIHIAEAQKNLFNLIWSLSKQPKKTTATVRYDE